MSMAPGAAAGAFSSWPRLRRRSRSHRRDRAGEDLLERPGERFGCPSTATSTRRHEPVDRGPGRGGMVTILPTIWNPIGRLELDDPGDVRAEVYRDLVMRRGDDGWFRWQTAFDPIPGCADDALRQVQLSEARLLPLLGRLPTRGRLPRRLRDPVRVDAPRVGVPPGPSLSWRRSTPTPAARSPPPPRQPPDRLPYPRVRRRSSVTR
jgi:hypothetical protein